MFHSQPLDWEVVESHAVAPVQVLFKEDGVKIRQIAPNEISGSYTFDMHPPRRTSPPASPRPKNMAAGAGRPNPVPGASTNIIANTGGTSCSTKKLHRRGRSAGPSPTGARAVSNPFPFGMLKRTTSPSPILSKEPEVMDTAEPKPERRRSLGARFSFLQPRHGRNRSGSTSSTKSGVSTSGTEDGDGAGSKLVPAVRKEKQERSLAQPPSTPTHHSTRSYFLITRSKATSAPNLTTPLAVVPPSPPSPAPAEPSYDKGQTKKVLKHARRELMKEVGKAGYNVLIVEGWELTILRQGERYRIKVVYRARPAIAESDSADGEGVRVPRTPPYLAMLDA